MIHRLVRHSVRGHRAVVLAVLVVVAAGVWYLPSAGVDPLPEFQPVTVVVQTEALGLSAEEVEDLITVPLEQDLLVGAAFLDRIHSQSVPGLSFIEMEFEQGTDLYRARQVVQERISQAAGLPNVSKPPQMLQPVASTGRTAMISMTSASLTPVQLGVLARWTVRPRLLAVPGVANVAIWGQRERQLQVLVDPAKLEQHHVTLEQVISTTGDALWVSPLTFLEASTPGTGGFIDTAQQRLGIQHNLPIVTADDLAEIPIDEATDQSLTLGDVATVVEDHQPLIGDAIINTGTADETGFMLVVEKLPGTNTEQVTQDVTAALDELGPALSGVTLDDSVFRPATYVESSIDHVSRSLWVGLALLVVALALLLLNWRTALAVIVAVVSSVITAAVVLDLFDQTFTTVVLAGFLVAIAAIVDDGVASVERIERHRVDAGADAGSRATRVVEAITSGGRGLVASTVVVLLAMVPLFFLSPLSGDRFFPPMAVAASLALIASTLVAFTVTPALISLLGGGRPRRSPIVRGLGSLYERALAVFNRSAIPAIAIVVVVIGFAAIAPSRFDASVLPEAKDTNLVIEWNAIKGTSLPEMDRITARAVDELRATDGVVSANAQVGQAVLGDRPVGSDSAQIWVTLDADADYDATLEAVGKVAEGYPGIAGSVTTYTDEKLVHAFGTPSTELTVRVFGQDLTQLRTTAGQIRDMVSAVDGIDAAQVPAPQTEPTMQIEVDLAKAKEVGIKPGDVRRAVATLLSGIRVGSLFEDQKIFDVQVWGTPETRTSLSSVQNLIIDTPTGAFVRLGDVANVEVRATLPSIEHEDISRYLDVMADVSGRDVADVERDVRAGLTGISFPHEFHAEILTDYTTHHDALMHLWGVGIAALIGIVLMLQAHFNSWRAAFVTFVTLPIGFAGGLVGARIAGGPITLATAAGLLAVLAVAVRNAVALVDRTAALRREAETELGSELTSLVARERFAPIFVSLVTTIALVLPLLLFGDIAGQEVLHSGALVLVAGAVAAALANLFILPTLYQRFGPNSDRPELDFGPGSAHHHDDDVEHDRDRELVGAAQA